VTETGDIVNGLAMIGAAVLRVTTDGTIIDTSAVSGGVISVGGPGQMNANASATTIDGMSQLAVLGGGTTTGATVFGTESVSDGGRAIGDTISGGGVEFVNPGGTTEGARVFGTPGVMGAFQLVGWENGNPVALFMTSALGLRNDFVSFSGGTANGTTVTLGIQTVAMGGVANNTVLAGGDQLVEIGGTANATMVNGGASNEIVLAGGIANGTTLTGVNSNEIANLWVGTSLPVVTPGGITIGTIINQFATENVSAGGVASNTRVNSGGSLLVGGGAAISGTTVLAGGQDLVGVGSPNAVATSTTLSGGLEVVEGPAANLPTGSALGTTVNGGDQIVFGSAVATTVNSGVETVWSGGISDSATMNAPGFQFVVGIAVGDTLNGAGATEFVISGGRSSGTTVNSGAVEVVSAGSQAAGNRINSGGNLLVNSGGLDVSATVAGGELVLAGGTASGTDIIAGGREVIFTGGTSLNPLIDGGVLQVQSGGSIGAPPVSFSANGGTLQLDASRSFAGLIAGFASPAGITEAIDLRDISFTAGTTKVVFTQTNNMSGTLTVTSGSQTTNLTLLGMYSTANFKLASDGAGGTLVTDPAVVTASASIAAPHT
jgi:autotransporter passenger strand-loop-strand repeat protein